MSFKFTFEAFYIFFIFGLECNNTISNTYFFPKGPYECILRGTGVDFRQRGQVTDSIVREAPNVRLQRAISVDCNGNVRQAQLECCVQNTYTVRWLDGATVLPTSKYGLKLEGCQSQSQIPCLEVMPVC